jgi:hypothetical protein
VWRLLRLQLLITLGSFRRAKLGRKLAIIFGVVGVLVFLGFVTFLSFMMLRFLLSPELTQFTGEVRPLLESVPVSVVSASFFGILVTSFGLLLQALYLAGDMDFLLSAPVQIRAVFISKLLQAVLPNFSLILLFSLPVLFGLAAALDYHWLFYPMLILMMIAMALAAAGVSSLMVMLVVRIFPARRVAEVLGLVVGVSTFICSQSGQIFNWVEIETQQVAQAVQVVRRFNTPWSPLAWAGRGLVSLGEREWIVGLAFLSLTFLFSAGIFYLSLVSSERLYYNGWASLQVQARRKKTQPVRTKQISRWRIQMEGLMPAPVRALVVKDYLVLRRDLRNLSQLITPLILGLLYSFWFLRSGEDAFVGRGEAPEWFLASARQLADYGNVGISLFVGWMLLTRLGMMAFAQEGKSYWVIKAAPLTARRLLSAKYLVAYLPSALLGLLFLLVTAVIKGASLRVVLFGGLVVLLCNAGMTGLNLGFGIVGAVLDWDDPRKMISGSVGCLGPLVSVIYAGLALGLFFAPPVVAVSLQAPEMIGQVIGLIIGGGFSLACMIGTPWLLRKRLSYLGEGI